MTDCPNIGVYGNRCDRCGQFHYTAMQLPLYETCDVCGRIVFGSTTGLPVPGHRACGEALNRWIHPGNFDALAGRPWRGKQAAQ